MTQSQETMWHKQHKVIHNEVGQNGARDRSPRCQAFFTHNCMFFVNKGARAQGWKLSNAKKPPPAHLPEGRAQAGA